MTGGRTVFFAAMLLGLALAPGCSGEADARPQLLVVVDTDMALASDALDDPAIAPDATIDTVRVDVVRPGGDMFDFRDFVAPHRTDWPISFGVAATEAFGSDRVVLRIRAFRGRFARRGELHGTATLESPQGVTVDRVVTLELPSRGVVTARVVLRGDCLARPASFLSAPTTCIDGQRTEGDPTEGIAIGSTVPPTLAGTWSRSREAPCAAAPPTGAESPICVPGGVSVLGDESLAGLTDEFFPLQTVPLRAVAVSPFFLDETEFTVGRFRALVNAGALRTRMPDPRGERETTRFCTWRGPDDTSADRMPLNCVPLETAEEACRVVGGRLPTEAEWEHAARGRGQNRQYPWGDAPPSCSLVSISRESFLGVPVLCDEPGVEPVASHRGEPERGLLGDASRDGVLDLGGSLSELVKDVAVPYDRGCWARAGMLFDPACAEGSSLRVQRGGAWSDGLVWARASLRRSVVSESSVSLGVTVGFRCAYGAESER